MNKFVWNAITQGARILVGALFIFSGVIKLNDPVGFGYKLEEYFSESVLNLPFLEPLALPMAVFLVLLEVLLGVALLVGAFRLWTLWLLALLMGFFTFLTFYSAYFNKVTDCGCFGDAIPLTPWESFTKDVVLSILIALLWLGKDFIHPLGSSKLRNAVLGLSLLAGAAFGYHVLNHLPVWDFRAYKPGTVVEESMKSAEELGLQGPVYETFFTLIHKESGESKEVSGTEYTQEKWYEKPEWELQADLVRQEKVQDGYVPPIHDFSLVIDGEDRTASVLAEEKVIWVTLYRLDRTNEANFKRISDAAWKWEKKGWKVIALTSSTAEEATEWAHQHNAPFEWALMDGTTVKTINRGNPGLTILRKGRIVSHVHGNDVGGDWDPDAHAAEAEKRLTR